MTIDQIKDDAKVHIGIIKFIRIMYKNIGKGLITLTEMTQGAAPQCLPEHKR